MSVPRRILKYLPAMVLGLLVLVWMLSTFLLFGVRHNQVSLHVIDGSLGLTWDFVWPNGTSFLSRVKGTWPLHNCMGELAYRNYAWQAGGSLGEFRFPIPLSLTLLLPVALGPFLSFRFRLWHFLAYTALIAVELAYYLRWQE
jgi:hypothetical protein